MRTCKILEKYLEILITEIIPKIKHFLFQSVFFYLLDVLKVLLKFEIIIIL